MKQTKSDNGDNDRAAAALGWAVVLTGTQLLGLVATLACELVCSLDLCTFP